MKNTGILISHFHLVLLFALGGLTAQELPPILTYEPDVYHAGNQNWMLAQNEDQFIYAANNEGLLEFNGYRWSFYPSPNETVLRSVLPHNGRVYSGSYMEFGYWERDRTGQLNYQSLSAAIKEQLVADEQFWNIMLFGDFVIFQSLQQLAFYEIASGEIAFVRPENGIFKAFTLNGQLYFSNAQSQLFQLESGTIMPVAGGQQLASPIVHCWDENGIIFVQTTTSGCYQFEDSTFRPVDRFLFLSNKRIYSGRNLRNGGLAFGTVSDGLYLIGPAGTVSYHLNQLNGLTNNTILSIFEDIGNNLWLGTDNGINCINVNSPFRQFTDRSGQLGTVYAAALHQGDLYLGSNQGLFVRKHHSNEPIKLVPGTQGQVWSLTLHDGQLFCAHTDGTFIVSNRQAQPIFTQSGTWLVRAIPSRPDLMLQGNYQGISVLEKSQGRWQFRNKVAGFDYSTRFLAQPQTEEIYVSHEYRGIYGLKIDEDYRRATELIEYKEPVKSKNAGLALFEQEVYYCSRQGLFQLNDFESGFLPAPLENPPFLAADYLSGKISTTDQRLWIFNQNDLSFLHRGLLDDTLQQQVIPVPHDLLNAISGYENITALDRDSVLIGTADGYLILAVDAIPLPQHELFLNNVHYEDYSQSAKSVQLDAPLQVTPGSGPPTLELSVPAYTKYFQPRFQYRILGHSEHWSDWRTIQPLTLNGLGYGDYVFEARSILGRRLSENTLSFAFTVQRPWYLSLVGFALFFGLATLLVYSLHHVYTGYYRRQQEAIKAENARQIALQQQEAALALSKLKNERLKQEVAGKSKDMANSMMSLVKKNELLQEIKSLLELKRPARENIKEVLGLIDRSLDESENWSLFQEAFEHADREFFQHLKSKHPDLTPNDLKLCAYLRLNLSSKEIAPLLNISVRSVEVKRYRLRKKLNLEREVGLVDYILSV